MSNTITIELCAEDRARLDRLAEALERKACDKCVTTSMAYVKATTEPEQDEIQQKLAETLAKAGESVEPPKNATETAEDSTPSTTPPDEEKPTQKEPTEVESTKTVGRAELRAKVIELSAKGLKEQTREIVRSYAQTVNDVPKDKVTECYEKLVALEG